LDVQQEDDVYSNYSYGGFIDTLQRPIRELESDMEAEIDHSDDDTNRHQEEDSDEEEGNDDEEDELEDGEYGEEQEYDDNGYFSGSVKHQEPMAQVQSGRLKSHKKLPKSQITSKRDWFLDTPLSNPLKPYLEQQNYVEIAAFHPFQLLLKRGQGQIKPNSQAASA
jgi:hypothetical protein